MFAAVPCGDGPPRRRRPARASQSVHTISGSGRWGGRQAGNEQTPQPPSTGRSSSPCAVSHGDGPAHVVVDPRNLRAPLVRASTCPYPGISLGARRRVEVGDHRQQGLPQGLPPGGRGHRGGAPRPGREHARCAALCLRQLLIGRRVVKSEGVTHLSSGLTSLLRARHPLWGFRRRPLVALSCSSCCAGVLSGDPLVVCLEVGPSRPSSPTAATRRAPPRPTANRTPPQSLAT